MSTSLSRPSRSQYGEIELDSELDAVDLDFSSGDEIEDDVLIEALAVTSPNLRSASPLVPGQLKQSSSVVAINPVTVDVSVAEQPRTWRQSLRKYFCAGQLVHKPDPQHAKNFGWCYTTFVWHRPRVVAIFLPLTVVMIGWFLKMWLSNSWSLFLDCGDGTPGYYATITMVFGAFVAGTTGMGGAVVAFPVLTLWLGVRPHNARDFGLMIQSVGMVSASFSILYSRLQVEYQAVLYAVFGGAIGLFSGLAFLVGRLDVDYVKVIFVVVFLAFGATLLHLNMKKRPTLVAIPYQSRLSSAILIFNAVLGGLFTAIGGTGVEQFLFATLTLYFRISEKVATPTGLLSMACSALLGFFYRLVVEQGIAQTTWNLWYCAVPAVALMAPVGAYCASFMHRQALACIVYLVIIMQFASVLLVVHFTPRLLLTAVGVLFGALMYFFMLKMCGQRRLESDLATNSVKPSPSVVTSPVATPSEV